MTTIQNWKPEERVKVGDLRAHKGKIWRCVRASALIAREPGTAHGEKAWSEAPDASQDDVGTPSRGAN